MALTPTTIYQAMKDIAISDFGYAKIDIEKDSNDIDRIKLDSSGIPVKLNQLPDDMDNFLKIISKGVYAALTKDAVVAGSTIVQGVPTPIGLPGVGTGAGGKIT